MAVYLITLKARVQGSHMELHVYLFYGCSIDPYSSFGRTIRISTNHKKKHHFLKQKVKHPKIVATIQKLKFSKQLYYEFERYALLRRVALDGHS